MNLLKDIAIITRGKIMGKETPKKVAELSPVALEVLEALKNSEKPITLSEIKEYCIERKNTVNPDKFFNYYESIGWKVGKNPMKNWKSAIHTWENSDFANNGLPKQIDYTQKIPAIK